MTFNGRGTIRDLQRCLRKLHSLNDTRSAFEGGYGQVIRKHVVRHGNGCMEASKARECRRGIGAALWASFARCSAQRRSSWGGSRCYDKNAI